MGYFWAGSAVELLLILGAFFYSCASWSCISGLGYWGTQGSSAFITTFCGFLLDRPCGDARLYYKIGIMEMNILDIVPYG
jgi:hypothetical protein